METSDSGQLFLEYLQKRDQRWRGYEADGGAEGGAEGGELQGELSSVLLPLPDLIAQLDCHSGTSAR